jgi:hypothetical protein
MSKPFAALAAVLITAPAYAQFEGELEMKMTSQAGEGLMKIAVGKNGVRNSMEIKTPQFPLKITMLLRKDTPDTAYTINDENKTYAEVDLKKSRPGNDKKFTAKKLGTEKVNGWNTVHAMVTDEQGQETEVWTNKDIIDWKSFLSSMGQTVPANEGMMKALKEIGAEGFFVKLTARSKSGRPAESMTMELVKATKKSMPASLFEIPKDYKKSEGGMGGMGGAALPPEVQKQLMEKMKNLTPEQQEQIRKAMEKQSQ